jgi:phospholipid/cholesterol/gamma-HCH transport system substrate-binding protein
MARARGFWRKLEGAKKVETEKFYFRVGIFFIIGAIAFVYYLITFGQGNETEKTQRYAIYFDHSIAGLARGAPVKLKGINVGEVNSVRFVSRDNDRILVLADIAEIAPVHTDTVASVASQGITGTTFLDLENINPTASPTFLKVMEGEKYPVIRSMQSQMQSLLADAPATMGKITQTVDQAQKLLSDQNIAIAEGLLPEAHDALTEAAGAFREIKMLARTIREDPSIVIRGAKYGGYQVPK